MTYKLLTPGPLTTSQAVKEAMLVDHCTWDDAYKAKTQEIRAALLRLGQVDARDYTSILLQGSGTFGVESVLSSVIAPEERVLILSNGAYGRRIVEIARYLSLDVVVYEVAENQTFDPDKIEEILKADSSIATLITVHNETTSGILNDLEPLARLVETYQLRFIVDAMSSFGGMLIEIAALNIDFLVSSANKCIQGVPGFSFVIARKETLEETAGRARSLSLDLHAQHMEQAHDGKWRFTSPTHTILAFSVALAELDAEGGILARNARYTLNNQILREEMARLGFQAYVTESYGPFITTFHYPEVADFKFASLYAYLKEHGYAIYPGKLSDVPTFRIANIGEIYPEDMYRVTGLIKQYMEAYENDSSSNF